MPLVDSINTIISNPDYADLFSIIKGFRNGAVYGAKIRFPHALVMTFMFRQGSLPVKMRAIFKATFTHSRNLAYFVTIYKTVLVVLKRARGGKEHHVDPFLAGLVGGYIVFGEDTNINNQVNQECLMQCQFLTCIVRLHQIVLYVFSRIAVGMAKLAVKQEVIPSVPHGYTIFASLTWAIVMWLFKHHRDTLQGSLRSSMVYLYEDSNLFSSVTDLLWVNK
ncbi:Tim17/Tim22/Tim23/Pmp24 family-domain-containing protein, partial [Cladochytrium replicatum]